MAFTYPLPDPESSQLVETVAPDGTVETAATPEVAAAINTVIDAQNTALIAAMQGIAAAIQQQLQAQASALQVLWQQITGAAMMQLGSQRAALEVVTQQIAQHVTNRIALQDQDVNTVAIHAALQPTRPPAMPQTNPAAPPAPPPPQPWAPGGPPPRPINETQLNPPPMQMVNVPPSPLPTPQSMPTQPASNLFPSGQSGTPGGSAMTPPGDQTFQPLQTPPMPAAPPNSAETLPPVPSQVNSGGGGAPAPGGMQLPPLDLGLAPKGSDMAAFAPLPVPEEKDGPREIEFAPEAEERERARFKMAREAGEPEDPQLQQQQDAARLQVQQMRDAQEAENQQAANEGRAPRDLRAEAEARAQANVQINLPPLPPPEVNRQQQPEPPAPDVQGRQQANEEDMARLRRIFRQAAPDERFQPPKMANCPWQLGMAIPKVGSPEWCRDSREITIAIAASGNQIVNWFVNYIDQLATMTTERFVLALQQGQWGGNTILQKIVQAIATPPIQTLVSLRQITQCWKQISSIAPACNPQIIMGLAGMKMVVRLLKGALVGVNAAVWATLQITLDVPQLERVIDYLMDALCPTVIPTAAEAWASFAAGYINEQQWRCWTLMNGEDPDLWRPVREAQGNVLAADQVILWGRLTGEDQRTIDTALYQRGWTRDIDRGIAQELYDKWYGGEEYIKWTFSGSLNPAAAQAFQLEDGFSAWWQGEPGQMARAHGWREDEARYNYRSLWVRPTPQEMQPWFWRMRDGGSARGHGITEDTIRGVCELQGITKWHQEAIVSCLYRPLSADEVLLLHQTDQEVEADRETAAIDSGLPEDQAKRVAKALGFAGNRLKATQEGGWSIRTVATARSMGIQLPAEAMGVLESQGFTEAHLKTARLIAGVEIRAQLRRDGRRRAASAAVDAALRAYTVGIVDARAAARTMVAAGWEYHSATTMLHSRDLSLRATRTSRILTALGEAVRKGEMTGLAAGVVMAQMGLRPDSIEGYMALWRADILSKRPHTSARDIRMLVAEGLLSEKAAAVRLANLGWKQPDLQLQLLAAHSRLAKAQEAARRRGAHEAAAAAREAEKVKQQALRRLEKSRPVGAIGQWYRDGLLTAEQVRRRMTQYGYEPKAIDLYIQGWDNQNLRRKKSHDTGRTGAMKPPERQVPLGTLRRWFIEGVADHGYAEQRLTEYGYDEPTRERYLAEWKATALDRQQRAEAKAQTRRGDNAGQ